VGADRAADSAGQARRQQANGELARGRQRPDVHASSAGCQWRAIPKDLPPRSRLYDYFDLWTWDGTLDRIHAALYVECRERAERETSPTAAIIDSQSVKSAEKGGLTTRMATMRARRPKARSGIFSSTRKAS